MICSKCGVDKLPTSEFFGPRKNRPKGIKSHCRSCENSATRARRGSVPIRPFIERFWSKVDREGPLPLHVPHLGQCWVWRGAYFSDGYGCISQGGKSRRAHRVSVLLTTGDWPSDQALHKCDNRACVRPDHIFVGTHADNMADRDAKGRTLKLDNHPSRVLTSGDVREIRLQLGLGVPATHLAKRYEVSEATVQDIKHRRSWATVK